MASEAAKLQSLTQTTIDSVKGYETAAERAKSPALQSTLREAAMRRQKCVDMLNDEIVRLGGERQTSGSTAGAAHRVWTQISDAFGSGDEKATDRVEEGEDYLEKKFREALDDTDFSPQTREVVQRAHRDAMEGERMTDRLAAQYN